MAVHTQRIDILTLFPEMFDTVLNTSILKRAATPVTNQADPSDVRPPVVSYHTFNFRDHTDNKHDKVDKPPYGGGPGMVIQCQPIWACLKACEAEQPELPITPILMTPTGQRLSQPLVEKLAATPRLTILCGHYEGFDQRVVDRIKKEHPNTIELSVGDYVLSGGEPAAIILTDSVVRLLPGVLGDAASAAHESFSQDLDGGLDYPHYTRPPEWDGRKVPAVLTSGDHAKIDTWRREQSAETTRQKRPDLQTNGSQQGPAAAQAFSGGPLHIDLVFRPVCDEDSAAVQKLLKAAYPTDAEAKLIRLLSAQDKLHQHWLAAPAPGTPGKGNSSTPVTQKSPSGASGGGEDGLQALFASKALGHVATCRVELIDAEGQAKPGQYEAIAPLTVAGEHQGQGLGTKLVEQVLRHAVASGTDALFVLGDPGFYGRFGFVPAREHGVDNRFAPIGSEQQDAFMVLPLTRNAMGQAANTTAQYPKAFDAFG